MDFFSGLFSLEKRRGKFPPQIPRQNLGVSRPKSTLQGSGLEKMEVALQFSECCAAEVALQHSLFCSAEVIFTKSCAAASEKLQRDIEKAALQESDVFLPLSCGFQAPTFRLPRLGPADMIRGNRTRNSARKVALFRSGPGKPNQRKVSS